MSYLTCLDDAGNLSREKMELSFLDISRSGLSARQPFPLWHVQMIDLRKMLPLYGMQFSRMFISAVVCVQLYACTWDTPGEDDGCYLPRHREMARMAFHDVLIVDLRELLINKSGEDDVPQFCPVGAEFSDLFASFERYVLQSPAYKSTKIYYKQEAETDNGRGFLLLLLPLPDYVDGVVASLHARLYRSFFMGGMLGYSRYLGEVYSTDEQWRRLLVLILLEITRQTISVRTDTAVHAAGEVSVQSEWAIVVTRVVSNFQDAIVEKAKEYRSLGSGGRHLWELRWAVELLHNAIYEYLDQDYVEGCPFSLLDEVCEERKKLYDTVLLIIAQQNDTENGYCADLEAARSVAKENIEATGLYSCVIRECDRAAVEHQKHEAKEYN